eukprot:CAMPEP_0201131450 /NCGR_PEP_ID=MMETSP0850-20130426/42819_1 /ASSEMBLY_ACC=CAM_ASM_000622 /TAXON_ID=183588 /ORGANISM="Pseudo-nitzschia fraudulenta, Strain WWA7" /LENGTH=415 /DNA_ID=CAMNT_0047401493 /DNA_START=259 /DNA_END=1506 /DNA_ORIENTATION=+
MSSNRTPPHLRQFAPIKYKKAPQAPRRFKSSYMFFSTKKHKEIRAELAEKGEGQKLSTTEVAKMVSQAWKALPEDEREKWEVMARQDKARYEMEKSMYTGPWKVPATKRASKDPKAPKRPMSAFLSFSNSKRGFVKNKYKDAKNAEVSRILAQMWKDADGDEKKTFIDEEFELRQQYKIAMTEWKRQSEEEIRTKRLERENEAMKAVREGKLPIRNEDQLSRNNGIGTSSTPDSSAGTGMKYSTKIASDTFGSSVANPFPPISQVSTNSARAPQHYSFSSGEYAQQQGQQLQYPPTNSSYYNPDHQSPLDSREHSNANYRNVYGAAYQMPGSNASGFDGYERRYDGSTPMGYDGYGQLHPYGYAPQNYYQQDYSQSAYPATDQSSQQNYSGNPPPQYYHYDPNRPPFDPDQSQQR